MSVMDTRISRQAAFMEVAHTMAKRADCFRLNVGAVITVNNRIVSTGWNGAPPGSPHCQGKNCPGADGCRETIHAEDNAFRNLPPQTGLLMKDLYVTDSPCLDCAQKIAKNRVARVFFATPYRDSAPLEWLKLKGIKCYRVLPSGTIIDWENNQLVDAETL